MARDYSVILQVLHRERGQRRIAAEAAATPAAAPSPDAPSPAAPMIVVEIDSHRESHGRYTVSALDQRMDAPDHRVSVTKTARGLWEATAAGRLIGAPSVMKREVMVYAHEYIKARYATIVGCAPDRIELRYERDQRHWRQ